MIVCGLFVFFVSLNIYSQSGQKYAVDGNNLSAGDRFGSNNYADVNIFTNSKKRATFTKDGLFDVSGQSRFRKNSIFDSLLTAFSIRTQSLQTDALTVINNGQIGGILTIGATLTFDGTNNKIISSAGVIDFSNNTLSTTGNFSATNITANHITSQAVQTNYLNSDSINTKVINAQNFLLNGAGLTQSPWITTTYGIVIDPAVQNKDVYMNRLFVQESVNIGNFRFSNGGSVVPPAPIAKDTIASQYEIVLRSTAEKLQLAANEVSVQQQLGVGKTPGAGVALDVEGDIRSTGNITGNTLITTSIQTTQLAISDKLESDTIHARKELFVNNSLRVAKEDINNFAEVSTKDTAVTLVLQKEEAAQVVIGPAPVTPVPTLPGQAKDKLTVIGNTLLQGDARIDGNTTINGNLKIKGFINADSMQVRGSLHIGDSSLVIDPNFLVSGFGYTDRVSSNQPAINVMRRNKFWCGTDWLGHPIYCTYYSSNIRMGIGTQSPQHALHLNFTPAMFPPYNQPVHIAFTNTSTGVTATDGFLVGIDVNGNAELNQQEDKDMLFYTGSVANGLNAKRMTIIGTTGGAAQGNVGIGTENPSQKLQVDGGNILVRGTNNFSSSGNEAIMCFGDTTHYIKSINGSGLRIGTFGAVDAISIQQVSGNVGVSNPNPYAKLDIYAQCRKVGSGGAACPTPSIIVRDSAGSTGLDGVNFLVYSDGYVYARDIHVIQAGDIFPDYVFEKNYPLMPINDLAAFIDTAKHLPDVPSASEVKEKGINLGDMDATLLKKIEELTLYVIELKKQNEEMQKEIDLLKKK